MNSQEPQLKTKEQQQMRNNKFWDTCYSGSIREKVAVFIDNSPILSHLKGDKYYRLEDALVSLIEDSKNLISEEVEREYHRDDVADRLIEKDELFNDDEILVPEVLDKISDDWQERLSKSDLHWDAVWDALDEAIKEKFGR